MFVYICACEYGCPQRPEEDPDIQELEFQVFESHPMLFIDDQTRVNVAHASTTKPFL